MGFEEDVVVRYSEFLSVVSAGQGRAGQGRNPFVKVSTAL